VLGGGQRVEALVAQTGGAGRPGLKGGMRVRGKLDGGTVVPRTAVFVRPRFVPNADLLTGLGCAVDAHGWVVHDPVGGRLGSVMVV
jgi:hypothetical protein